MAAYSGDEARAFATRNLFPDPATRAKVEALDNVDGLRNTGEVSGALFRKGLLRYHFTNAALVRSPVLVIAGLRDFQAAIEPQKDLVRALPNAVLIEYESSGHFMFVEDPRRFARDISEFLRSVSPSP
jgi:proline iminopeptidase